MLVLIGCEESQTICKEFRALGVEAYSCDLLPCSGGHPEWHLQMDVFEAIKLKKWDLGIFHPTCTFLSSSGAQWYYHPEDRLLPIDQRRPHPKYPNRAMDREDAVKFFLDLYNCDIPRVALENPVGIMSSRFRKPDFIVNPWQFGDSAQKTTCFWTRGLPELKPTNIVDKGEFIITKSGKKLPKWYVQVSSDPATRRTQRSKTFPGMAKAIAEQWTDFLNKK